MNLRMALLAIACAAGLSACAIAAPPRAASPSPSAAVATTPSPRALVPPTDLVEAGTLTFGSDISYPPQEDYDPSHQPVGFDIDLARAIAQRLGLRVKFVQQNFDTLINTLPAKKYDAIISAMSITDERKKSVAFIAYFQAGQAIVVKKGNPAGLKALGDLCGRKVAVPVNTPEHDTLISTNQAACKEKVIGITTFPSDLGALEKVEQNQADAAMVDSPVAWNFAKTKGTVEVAGDPIANVPEGIGVLPASTSLYDAIRAALKQLIADATYKELLEKWGLQDGAIPPEAV